MKILLYTDVHWSTNSSILRSKGKKYSTRLENLIQSVSWAEDLAKQRNCDLICCLGDFFDKAQLNAEELTALQDIKWSGINHIFLVGNHEMGTSDLSISSSHFLNIDSTFRVVDKPEKLFLDRDNVEICYLPYVLDNDLRSLSDIFGLPRSKRIVFSHNDIAGIQMGAFVSKEGFSVDDIEANCNFFVNGHLHNSDFVSDKIMNLGNLSGQNFSEDSHKYPHGVMIFDTETFQYELVINPFALKFYKLDMCSAKGPQVQQELSKLSTPAVLTCSVSSKDQYDYVNSLLKDNSNVIASRIIIVKQDAQASTENSLTLETVDHLLMFKKYVESNIGSDEITLSELAEVLK